MYNNFWKIFVLIIIVLLFLSLAGNIVYFFKDSKDNNKISSNSDDLSLLETVSAEEIYPLFECPCCGKFIDECSCGMAAERRGYIDASIEISDNASRDKIVLAYVKKYGLNSFMDEKEEEKIREKLVKEAPAERPIISLSPDSYDFEDVSQGKGIVEISFKLRNEGKKDLVINELETSCGCTSASIVYQGEESPIFSMPGHGENEEIGDWQIAISSGEEAELKVYYDPNVHEEFRGSAIREISVFSNDPIDFQKSVSIELNQID